MNKGGEEPSPKRLLFVAAMGMTAMAAGQLSTGWPETPLQWGFLVGALIAVFLAAVSELLEKLWKWLRRKTNHVLPGAVLVVAVLVLLALTGRLLAVLGPPLVGAARVQLHGCPQPVLLRLLTTPEGLPIARELTTAFEQQTARGNFRCPQTTFFVYAAEPAKARDAIAQGWGPERLRALGPRPDLWFPGSTYFEPPAPGDRLSHVESASFASSPIILAVPEDLIGVDPREFTWAQALQKWAVARPDPSGSLVGTLATLAVYESRGIRDAGQARAHERSFEQALDTGGYPLDGLLCRHTRADPPRIAVIVAEQELERFNRGLPLGGQCAGASGAHGRRMVAVRPSPTRTLDHPAVRLEWTDAGDDQIRHAREFVRWLGGAQGRTVLRDAGLRPGPVTVPRSSAEDMRLLDVHAQATRPGRILLALDTSGSMRQTLSDGVTTRFSVAVQGVAGIQQGMGGRDQLALWVFPGAGGRQELLAMGPGGREPPLQGLVPTGQTPLYRTIIDGVLALPPNGEEAIRALVVLTDGEDSGSGVTPAQLLDAVSGKGVRVFVIAVGEASCASQGLAGVTELTGGACVQTGFAGLESALSRVFTTLWKGV